MKIPKILAEKGVTEHDVLESNSNTYTPGFMQIYLRRSFPGKIKDMEDVQAQGSFLHEYILAEYNYAMGVILKHGNIPTNG